MINCILSFFVVLLSIAGDILDEGASSAATCQQRVAMCTTVTVVIHCPYITLS